MDSRSTQNGYRVWGLTGGVASGKSLVARFFAEHGFPSIDADRIARELSEPGGLAASAILARFGTLDRKALRDFVFSSPSDRKDLESILHPLIQAESMKRIKALGAPIVIYEAALLVETGRWKDLDGLIVVTTDTATQAQRLMARDGCSRELAEKIIAAQISNAERTAVATHLIENHEGLPQLREKVSKIATLLK